MPIAVLDKSPGDPAAGKQGLWAIGIRARRMRRSNRIGRRPKRLRFAIALSLMMLLIGFMTYGY